MRKYVSFINRQVNQVCEDGGLVLLWKFKKMFTLIVMNIFAPLAVHFKIDWFKAYAFVGHKNVQKLKKLRMQPIVDELALKTIEDQAVQNFKTIVNQEPSSVGMQEWIEASRSLGERYFLQGKQKEMSDVFNKEVEVWRNMTQTHQFDDLGIEFIPRYMAVGSVGNYEHLDAYIKAEKFGWRPSKKLILLVDPRTPVNNPCYLRYWSRYVTVISDPKLIEMLTPLEKRLTVPLNLYMILHEKMHKSFFALGAIRQQWVAEKRAPILALSDEDYERGWQCLKPFGVQKDDWFVCLHVRESGWKDGSSSEESFRNADINAYKLAIKAVTDAGGWVIRLGDSTMKPLSDMPRVIDYAHSDAKSDWMDVFLCAQCRFIIGTSSGPITFAMAFGNPAVITNYLPTCCAYYITSNDLFIPRICKFKEKDRLLSFEELFSPMIRTAAVQSAYDKRNIEVITNTEEELKDLVEEMLERCLGCLENCEEDEKLQKLFKSATLDRGNSYGEEKFVVNARIGKSFLRKYVSLLPSGEKAELLSTSP